MNQLNCMDGPGVHENPTSNSKWYCTYSYTQQEKIFIVLNTSQQGGEYEKWFLFLYLSNIDEGMTFYQFTKLVWEPRVLPIGSIGKTMNVFILKPLHLKCIQYNLELWEMHMLMVDSFNKFSVHVLMTCCHIVNYFASIRKLSFVN